MFEIRSNEDLEIAKAEILKNCDLAIDSVRKSEKSNLELMEALKFAEIGFHPLSSKPVNLIEQINQTFTYLACLSAVRHLLDVHSDVSGFVCAPGASAETKFDIMSIEDGLVAAEVFAAVNPTNNQKLLKDQIKLSNAVEKFRYCFFSLPKYLITQRQRQLEKFANVEVWSVEII